MPALPRLCSTTLKLLPPQIQQPRYDVAALATGIVHLGIGAFHRAHQAVFTDDVLQAGDRRWGILGASLRSPGTRDALAPQDLLYTLSERDEAGERLRVIGALRQVLVAPENPAALIQAMCEPAVKIVSLTVTEKGYCHDPAHAELNEDHPDIRHDLANPLLPRSAPGFLAAALHERKARGLPPFTVLCCDNLPANGRTVRNVVSRLAALRDAAFGRFVEESIAFPSTMVDRIVPATTDADRARIATATGLHDAWPVVTEVFKDWVIEDHFPQTRPAWAATFVTDVAPFELMKLRLLNGAHSALAYLGCLAGYGTVAEAMADPALAHFLTRLMHDEVKPTLQAGRDLDAYIASLLERFRNPALRHSTAQIAMDGSQKLPQRLLGTIRDRLKAGAPIACLCLGVAAWMRYVTGIGETGAAIEVRDPLRDELRRRADAAGFDAARLAAALLGVEAVFGRDLPAEPRFAAAVTAALDQLLRLGAQQALERFRSESP